MIEHWGFQPATKPTMPAQLPGLSTDMYSKITIASPDKDLLQIPDTWFYDYKELQYIATKQYPS
jgi:hypothetical protein